MDNSILLKQHGLRVTPLRRAALDVLKQASTPVDHQHILKCLIALSMNADLVTIYRMMDVFVECGIVKMIDFQDGRKRFEIEGDHHHHLICTQCGAVEPIHEPCIAVNEETVLNEYGFKITRHQLEFFGLCRSCNK